MPRPIPQHAEPVNGDSFLDIVASVVSIMIIMVVMEGMRIKNAPVTVAIPANPAATELEKDVAAEQSLRGDVLKMAEEIRSLQQEAARRGMQRDVLATMVSAVEQKIQERRQKLDAAKQADFDLARGLSESKFQLDQLNRQRQQAENTPARADRRRKLSHADQPGGGRPRGPPADLQRPRGVRARWSRCWSSSNRRPSGRSTSCCDQPELTDTVGPVDGFRLRYTLERHDVSPEEIADDRPRRQLRAAAEDGR